MVKKYIIALFILFSGMISVSAQSGLISEADKAYMADNFEEALELYMQVAHTEGTSSQLMFNIANTYYRLGNLGKSVLYYKKALKLDPTNTDARTNLEFVRSRLVDSQESSVSATQRITENIIFLMTPNGWAVTGIIFFVLFLIALGFYFLSDSVGTRKLCFFGGLGLIALTTLTTIVAFHTSGLARDNKEAVVTTDVVQLSTVPRMPQEKNEQAFTLHEGALVEIIDSISVPTDTLNPVWLEVKVNNEHRAWISANDISRI